MHNDYGVSYREGASVSGGKSFGGGGGGCGGAQSDLVGTGSAAGCIQEDGGGHGGSVRGGVGWCGVVRCAS